MSSQRFRKRSLAPEDDWFVEPDDVEVRVARGEWRRPSANPPEPHDPREPTGERNRTILLVVASGAALLLVAGLLIAGVIGGSDGGGETTAASLPTTTTAPLTPPTTEPTPTQPETPVAQQPPVPEGVVLQRGAKSAEVRQLQEVLVELGYSTGGVDGEFGAATEQAIRAFQTSSGLVNDGVVGPATLEALAKALSRL